MNSEAEFAVTRFDCSIPHKLNMGPRSPIPDLLKRISDATNCIIGENVAEVLKADERIRDFNSSFFTSTGTHLGLHCPVYYRILLARAKTRGNALSALESAYILGFRRHGLEDEVFLSIMEPVKLSDGGEYVLLTRRNKEAQMSLVALNVNDCDTWDPSTILVRGGLNVGMQIKPDVDLGTIEQLF